MMTEDVIKELNREEQTDFHVRLKNKCITLVDGSRQVMSQEYSKWDKRQKVYLAERDLDQKDRKAVADNEPTKMVIPMSTAQINTFVSSCLMLLRQRARFFEFDPSGTEDYVLREPSERILERDLRYNKHHSLLHQFFLNLARYGIGVIRHHWVEETVKVLLSEPQEVLGQLVAQAPEYQEVPTYSGNKLDGISPYNFFPDTRLPLTKHQEGEYCASDEEFTKVKLQRMEDSGLVAGIEHVKPFTAQNLHKRYPNGDYRFYSVDKSDPTQDTNNFCVTECQVWLTPSEFELEGGKKLGKEDSPILYLVNYVNDDRIIRVEPMNNMHSSFTYEVAQFTPDEQRRLSTSLADMVGGLQELSDWYINARISAVKKTLENNIVVDPRYINMQSLKSRSSIVTLSKHAPQGGIGRTVMPLPVQDNTQNHFDDISRLNGLMDQATGVMDPLKGQAQQGRRSAFEMRSVVQGGMNRIVTLCLLAWEQAIQPTGIRMLTNHRQNVDLATFTKIMGEDVDPIVFNDFRSSAIDLIGNNDLFIFDGVSPSEKNYMAESLQELFIAMLQQPDIAISNGWDLSKMLKEIYELRGITGLDRFKLTPEEQQQQMMQQILMSQQQVQQNANATANRSPSPPIRSAGLQ